jgi:MoxR-like ATPase
MPFPFYKRDRKNEVDPQLPPAAIKGLDLWSGYEADEDLEAAVNVALLLGQPLLLTGAPGTGKTQLAFHVSNQFGWGDPLIFEAKSTSSYRDLFYTYDALGRFHAKDAEGASRDVRDYIEYNALGRAILRTRHEEEIKRYLGESYKHDGPKPSVVLIDEIDKAPRDFPNDILREIENLYFKVPEIDLEEVAADPDHRIVVVITSNSEKNLPPAFLRRCTYFHIKPPSDKKLLQILTNRFGELAKEDNFYTDAIALYNTLRKGGLEKAPATAELLAWVAYLRQRGITSLNDPKTIRASLAALVKSEEDTSKASTLVGI